MAPLSEAPECPLCEKVLRQALDEFSESMTEAIHGAIDGPSLSGNEDRVDGKAKDLISGKVQTLMANYNAAISSFSPSTKLKPAEKHALSPIHDQASCATDIISQFLVKS